MGLAPGRLGRAEHATAIANNQGATLGVRGSALGPPVPERLALAREQQPEQLGTARQALQFGLRDGTDAGDLASTLRILPGHHVSRGHNDNLMPRWERPRSPIATPPRRGRTGTPIPTGILRFDDRGRAADHTPAIRRHCGWTGMEADSNGEGVEAALFDAAGIGVLSPALGTPDAIGNAVDERAELGTEHPVEGGVRHEHAVVAVTEVQAAPPALAQVLLVQVGGILVALRPVLYVPARTVGGHSGHLRQQLCIAVHGLGAGRPGGAGQSIGVLRRDVTLRQRAGDLRHLGQRAGPLPSSPRLAM